MCQPLDNVLRPLGVSAIKAQVFSRHYFGDTQLKRRENSSKAASSRHSQPKRGDVSSLFHYCLPFSPCLGMEVEAQPDLDLGDPSRHISHWSFPAPPRSSSLIQDRHTNRFTLLLTFAQAPPFLSCPPRSGGTQPSLYPFFPIPPKVEQLPSLSSYGCFAGVRASSNQFGHSLSNFPSPALSLPICKLGVLTHLAK